jgi:hypothetical protein
MENGMKIVNQSGDWLQSTAQFRLVDPSTGTAFAPAEPTKATRNAWVQSQPCILRAQDPTAEASDASQAALDKLNAEDAAARAAAEASADKVIADDNARMLSNAPPGAAPAEPVAEEPTPEDPKKSGKK